MNPLTFSPTNPDTASINAAIVACSAAGGGDVVLPAAVYSPLPGDTPTKIRGASNVHLRGVSKGAVIIQIPNHYVFQDYLIDGYMCDNFKVSDMTLDMGDIDPLDDQWGTIGTGSGAIHFGTNGTIGGSYCAASNIEIKNLGRYGVVAHGSRGLRVEDMKITRTAPINGNDTGGVSNVGVMLRPGPFANVHAHIERNETINVCGISAAIFKSGVADNVCRLSGYGANIAIEDWAWCLGNIISNNITADSVNVFGGGPNGLEVWGDHQTVSGHRSEGNAGPGIAICGGSIRAIGCVSEGNAGAGFWIHPSARAGNALIANSTSGNSVPLDTHGVTIVNSGNDLR